MIVELVARLVWAQCPHPLYFRFPLGDSIGQPGEDGLLEAADGYPPYINAGISIWEIGTNAEPGKKITEDYKKRLKEIPDVASRSKTTFTFVTPRSAAHTLWTPKKQDEWKKKREHDGWKSITIMDGTILSKWLERFPAIAAWLLQIMNENLSPCTFETSQMRWEALKHIPGCEGRCLTPEVFLCDREKMIARINVFLKNEDERKLPIRTRYPDQLANFIAAYVEENQNPETGDFYDNIIILEKADELKNFLTLDNPHIFVLGETNNEDYMVRLHSNAIKNGHRLILPQNIGGHNDEEAILPMPTPGAMQLALQRAGFSDLEAQSLAAKSNGNIPSLLRLLSSVYAVRQWGDLGSQSILAIASLIGNWSEQNQADLRAVEEVSGKSYEEWKKELTLLSGFATTPLRQRSDGTYRFISRYEGWQIGGSILSKEDLERFLSAAENILAKAAHSAFSNPLERLLAESDNDKAFPSEGLIYATAEMLAIIASNLTAWTKGSPDWLDSRISSLVKTILSDDDLDLWIRLSDILPLLAEAAPQSFISTIREQVSSEIFLEKISTNESFGRNQMTGIIWALECLAWSPSYFPQAIDILGDLSQAKLPKNSANRPDVSLKEIFNIWSPHTCVDTECKAKHLARLAKKHPLVAWKIILAISPYGEGGQAISFGTYMPRWRELSLVYPHKEEELDYPKWAALFEAISSPALSVLLEQEILPLENLISGLTRVPDKIDTILKRFTACVGTPKQTNAWELLSNIFRWGDNRKLLERHKDSITAAISSLKPDDKYQLLKDFFSESIPNYDFELPLDEQFDRWRSKQAEIVKSVFYEDGLKGVLHLVSLAKMPNIVGQELANISNEATDINLITRNFDTGGIDEKATGSFLAGFIYKRYDLFGDVWLQAMWEILNDETKLDTLLDLPFSKSIWNFVEMLPEDLQNSYWRRVICRPDYSDDDLEYPLQRLILAKRNGNALQWLYYMMTMKKKPQITTLKKLLLNPDECMARNQNIILSMIEYVWQEASECDDEIVQIEFLWIDLFNRFDPSSKLPKCLNRKLLTDAEFFVAALCVIYKPRHKNHEKAIQDENSQYQASQFYHALSCLRPPEESCFYDQKFTEWVETVLLRAEENDRYEVAGQQIGKILFHAPPDVKGLWINKNVAAILNAKEHVQIRVGFHTESFNSRGVYYGSGGKNEDDISNTYAMKAMALRDEGFFIFADCIDDIAKDYAGHARWTRESSSPIDF